MVDIIEIDCGSSSQSAKKRGHHHLSNHEDQSSLPKKKAVIRNPYSTKKPTITESQKNSTTDLCHSKFENSHNKNYQPEKVLHVQPSNNRSPGRLCSLPKDLDLCSLKSSTDFIDNDNDSCSASSSSYSSSSSSLIAAFFDSPSQSNLSSTETTVKSKDIPSSLPNEDNQPRKLSSKPPTSMTLKIPVKNQQKQSKSHRDQDKNVNKKSTQQSKPMTTEQRQNFDRSTEPKELLIDPSFYRPPSNEHNKPDPIINHYSIKNRPLASRKMVPVSSIFRQPISNFWKSKWHSFNHMQSEVSQVLSKSDENVVISAPTGAGKTCIFEMAIGRLFQNQIDNQHRSQEHNRHTLTSSPNSNKILYISPSKALCQERYDDWATRIKTIHPSFECAMLTGDSSEGYATLRDVENSNLILTTPEKWDLITRKWTDNFFLIGSVKLILIDEIHFIGTDDRGACLEVILCRMKTVQRAVKAHWENQIRQGNHWSMDTELGLNSNMRMVAVSATLPNVVDIAAFLDTKSGYVFDSSYRPVPLTTHVVGLGYIGKNQFLFDKNLNRHIPDLIRRFSKCRPTIVFCHTKKQTEALATELLSSVGSRNPMLAGAAHMTNLATLKKCLAMGIAYHHAGMESEDRKLVEDNFSKGLVKYLCATSTLAMGVNLPAHLVIIKGTSVWRGSGQGYQELDSGSLLQMMGRAGRPGFDDSGTAVIMTDTKSKSRYDQMTNGLEVVESTLLKDLTETLNTEISQKVITSVKEAVDWMKGTFFFIRVRKNPKRYGIKEKDNMGIESYLTEKCMESIKCLCQTKIINLSENGNDIEPRRASHIMSRHMIPFQGMKAMVELPHDTDKLQILHCLSNMEGIQYPVRRSEKALLNEAHKSIKYKLEGGPPSKIRIQTSAQKAFVLLQAGIGQHYFNDFTLRQEMSSSIEFASRILAATEDYSIEESKHGKVALEALLLRRCLATSLWSANDGVLNQLRGVGAKSAAKLASHNIKTFDDILLKSSNDIEQACGRKSPFGQELKKVVGKIMSKSLKLQAYVKGLESDDQPNELICHIFDNDLKSDIARTSAKEEDGIVTYTLAVHTDRPNGSLMFRTEISGEGSHRIRCPNKFGRIYIHLVSNLIGLDYKVTIDGNDSIQKSSLKLSPPKPKKSVKKTPKISKVQYHLNQKSPSNGLKKMVKDVEDFRLTKSVNKNKFSKDNEITSSDSKRDNSGKVLQNQVSPLVMRKQPHVTPSPLHLSHPRVVAETSDVPFSSLSTRQPNPNSFSSPKQVSRSRIGGNAPNIPSSSSYIQPSSNSFSSPIQVSRSKVSETSNCTRQPFLGRTYKEKPIIRDPKQHCMQLGSWQKQKTKQKRFQQRAFGSSKENPFSMFKFDPNNVEKQLEIESVIRYDMECSTPPNKSSVLPPSSYKFAQQPKMLHATRRSRFHVNGINTVPPLHSSSKLIGSTKRRKAGTPIQCRQSDLLRQKAAEQQSYIAASRQHRMNQCDSFQNVSKLPMGFHLSNQSQNHHIELGYEVLQPSSGVMYQNPTEFNNMDCLDTTYLDDSNIHYSQVDFDQHNGGSYISPIYNNGFHGALHSHQSNNDVDGFRDSLLIDQYHPNEVESNQFSMGPTQPPTTMSYNNITFPNETTTDTFGEGQYNQGPDFFEHCNQFQDDTFDEVHGNSSNMEGMVIDVASNTVNNDQNTQNKSLQEADDGFDAAFF